MFAISSTFRSLVPLSFGFLILLASAGASLILSSRQQQANSDVRTTLEFENLLNRIQALSTDAETAQRGYLLTGRLAYLDPFQLARQELPAALEELAKQPEIKVENLTRLKSLIAGKLTELKQTADFRAAGMTEDALAIVNGDSGMQMMTDIRDAIASMRSEGRALLEQRIARAAAISRGTQIAVVGSVILVIILAAFALRDARDRVLKLETSNAQLETEIAERQSAEGQLRQLQKMEAIGQLTGGIAHDFNNMLAIIIGSLSLARRQLVRVDPHPLVLRYLDTANEGAKKAATLTSRLLAFSRQQPLDPRVIDANKLVGGMSELLQRTLGETIHIETVLSAGLWRTLVDPAQIENAIVNLAVNARDAMPSGGRLTIETGNTELDERYARVQREVSPGQYILISVTDTGIGMTADVIERAFDPFYTTKDIGVGTGLGLSQVFGFVKQSRGHVKLYSEPGQGTTVKLYLPRYHGVEPPADKAAHTGELPLGNRNEIVLVVEDDDNVRSVTVHALKELGYTVIEAAGPKKALEQLDVRPDISLLLTDIVMPDMNGRELAEKALARRPSIKVLYTTGYTRNAIIHNGTLDPGTAFIAKPFSLEQLAIKVREVLS